MPTCGLFPPMRRPFNKDEHGKRDAMQRRMLRFRKRIQKQAKRRYRQRSNN